VVAVLETVFEYPGIEKRGSRQAEKNILIAIISVKL